MVNASENLAAKKQVDNALDLGDKIRGKIKEPSNFYFYVILLVKVILMMMDHKIV